MFDARDTEERAAVGAAGAGDGLKPVLAVLHQPHSSPGYIGHSLIKHGHTLDVRRPRYGDPLPETLAQHAGAVIFGGPMSANDSDDFVRLETEWIGVALREKKPFLGICLGAQMLSNHLGAKVTTHAGAMVEIGYYDICPTGEAARFGVWPQRVYQWHREGFEVPSDATLLARSDGTFCNQAYVYGPAAVAVQFHPEITYAMVSRWSGHNPHRLTLPGARDRASQLTDHVAHAPAVRSWVDGFLGRWLSAG